MIINVTLSFEFDENFEYAPAAIANHLAEKLRNEEYQHRNCCISALMPESIEPFIQELTVDCEDAVATVDGYQLGDVHYAPTQEDDDDEYQFICRSDWKLWFVSPKGELMTTPVASKLDAREFYKTHTEDEEYMEMEHAIAYQLTQQ